MDLLISTSLITAFIAGLAALFAPCCITVLLPAYFASIFRERSKVFLMTFLFFLGILAVFLPIGLGAAMLGQFFKQNHDIIFGLGGLFLMTLGIVLLTGKHLSMPFKVASPVFKKHHALSVFTLGIFSGIATTCCAPVLAGALALSILPGSIFWGAIYTLSYVFGMVAPLFLLSLFLDKVDFSRKFTKFFQRQIVYSLGGKKFNITVSETVSGITFLFMGILISYLALTDRLFIHSEYQTNVNIFLTKAINPLKGAIQTVPEYIWAALLLIIVAFFTKLFISYFQKEKYEDKKQN